MFFLLAITALVWSGVLGFGLSRGLRDLLCGLVLIVVIVFQLVSADSPLSGDSTADPRLVWLVVIFIALMALAYGYLLSKLRAAAARRSGTIPDPTPKDAPFSDPELERYARHIVLREIGGAGQKALKDASVLVVGAGGLGAPALQYLAAAGVGTIGVIDDDVVENSNLQRQVIHTFDRIGLPKVQSAQRAMTDLNPAVQVKPYHRRLTPDFAADLVAEYDLVLDGTDNFDTRYLVNEACTKAKVPLISAALTQWEGQISLYDPATGTPCYRCIFPDRPDPALVPSCAEGGVLGPLPGVVGAMMAVEAVKAITGAGEGLRGRLLIYDALYADTRIITLKPKENCEVCG